MKKIIFLSVFVLLFVVAGVSYAGTTPSIKIISPTNFNVETGELEVKWTSKDLPADDLISFVVNHKLFSINTIRTTNDGKEAIPLPFPGRYDIEIVNNGVIDNPTVYKKFSLFVSTPNNDPSCPDGWKPSVKVLSPNGGETYSEGQEIEVKWLSCNILPSTLIAIDFVGDNTNGTTFTKYLAMTPNTGSATIKLPEFNVLPKKIKEGNTFRIKVRTLADEEKVRDFSDGRFSILNYMPAYGPIDIDL